MQRTQNKWEFDKVNVSPFTGASNSIVKAISPQLLVFFLAIAGWSGSTEMG